MWKGDNKTPRYYPTPSKRREFKGKRKKEKWRKGSTSPIRGERKSEEKRGKLPGG